MKCLPVYTSIPIVWSNKKIKVHYQMFLKKFGVVSHYVFADKFLFVFLCLWILF